MRDLFASGTRLDQVQMCWRYYNYVGRRKLVPFTKGPKLEKGSVGHKILAYFYREVGLNINREVKKDRDKIIEEAFKLGTLEAAKTDLKIEVLRDLFDDLRLYFIFWQNDGWFPLLDDKGEPLVEVPLTKIIYERPDTEESEGVRVIFNGIIDLVLPAAKVDGVQVGPRIVDHKFKDRFSELNPLDNQLSLYSATTGIPDVMRNDVGGQKEGNVNKFRRQPNRYQPEQMKENIEWAVYWMLDADYHEAVDVWPPNITSCDKFGGCQFKKVCSKIESVREAILNANFKRGKAFSIYEEEKLERLAPAARASIANPVAISTGPVPDVRREEVPEDTAVHVSEQEVVPLVQQELVAREELRDEPADVPTEPEPPKEERLADRLIRAALEKHRAQK